MSGNLSIISLSFVVLLIFALDRFYFNAERLKNDNVFNIKKYLI